MGLHVGKVGTKKRLCALNRQRFCPINEFTATVIALAGVALGVFVGQHRALSLQHTGTAVVLRGNEFNVLLLPDGFSAHGGPQLGIKGFNGLGIAVEVLRQMGGSLIHSGFLRLGTGHPFRDFRLGGEW